MSTRQVRPVLALIFVLLNARSAFAQADCPASSSECVAEGGWNFSISLGAGIRTNPLSGGKDLPLVVVPQFSYYGKRVFVDNLDLGFTLAEDATQTLNIIATPGYDRVFFYRSDLQNILVGTFTSTGGGSSSSDEPPPAAVRFPPRARRIIYLAGPEWTFQYHRVSGQLDLLHEITDQNRGDEIRAALGIPLVESKGSLTFNFGVTWKSAAIVNYYYGAPGIYEAGSALDPFAKLGYSHPLGGRWNFTAFAQYERLGNEIANSPIISEHHVVTAFVGTKYTF